MFIATCVTARRTVAAAPAVAAVAAAVTAWKRNKRIQERFLPLLRENLSFSVCNLVNISLLS
jgi:hypothetical protein